MSRTIKRLCWVLVRIRYGRAWGDAWLAAWDSKAAARVFLDEFPPRR